MTTTIDIPDPLFEMVKAKAEREGYSVPFVTESLYKAWLINAVPSKPREPPAMTPEQAKKWIAQIKAVATEINRNSADPRTLREILNESRR